MVLAEESTDCLVFRSRGGLCRAATLVLGLGPIAGTGWLQAALEAEALALAVLYIFGFLLLYSALNSFIAKQCYIADGLGRSIFFTKQTLWQN